jgi:hypothetical protein
MNSYKSQKQLADENPGGLDTLPNCHNFSSNPGFLSTADMLGKSAPANGDGVIRGTSARGSLPDPQPRRSVRPSGGGDQRQDTGSMGQDTVGDSPTGPVESLVR